MPELSPRRNRLLAELEANYGFFPGFTVELPPEKGVRAP
jgi:hypothetical protein